MAAFNPIRFCLILVTILSGCWVDARVNAAVVNFLETEPNNSLLTANLVPHFFTVELPILGVVNIGGALSPGDVDYYQFTFTFPVSFDATVWDSTPQINDDNDSVLGLFSSAGELLHFNDDAFPGDTLSAIFSGVLLPGTYYMGISGGGDNGFVGVHQESFQYLIVINLFAVPGPGALALFGTAILLGHRARRRS
jgi:hypothetical protein